MKPRISQIAPGFWRCEGDDATWIGGTPQLAYQGWNWRIEYRKFLASQAEVSAENERVALVTAGLTGLMTPMPSFPQQVYA